jgi:hypothetical protein
MLILCKDKGIGKNRLPLSELIDIVQRRSITIVQISGILTTDGMVWELVEPLEPANLNRVSESQTTIQIPSRETSFSYILEQTIIYLTCRLDEGCYWTDYSALMDWLGIFEIHKPPYLAVESNFLQN